MVESESGQDEANPVLWLATWAGSGERTRTMALGISLFSPASFPLFGHLVDLYLTKLVFCFMTVHQGKMCQFSL